MSYWFGATSSYGYGYNAQIGVMPPQPAYVPGQSPGMNYYPTSTIGVAPYAPVSSGTKPMGYDTGYSGYISHPYVYNPPQASAAPSGGKTMYNYYSGYSSSYTPSYTSGTVPNYVDVTPSNFTYGNPVAPAIEQAGTTADNPYGPYQGSGVTVTPSNFNPYAPYTGGYVQVTPQNPDTLPQYQSQTPRSGGSGGGSGGGTGSGGQSPQRQQPQQQQRPVTIQINTGSPNHRSGAGYAGGNTGALYNPSKQNGSYYGGSGYGGQASAMANYNAPSIVPYLMIGGIGVAAYMLLKKHH